MSWTELLLGNRGFSTTICSDRSSGNLFSGNPEKNNTELVRQVYDIMTHCPSKHDWLQTVENDLSQLGLGLSKDAIKSFSKDGFKAIVKKQLHVLAHKYLTERKPGKLINMFLL